MENTPTNFGAGVPTLTEDNKRWLVYGIALNHVLVPSIRPMLDQEILQEYNDLKTNHGIDVQTTHSFPVPRYPNVMKYENINANDTKLKPPHYKKLDSSKFDYKVKSHVDFAKLFLQNHMAKFNAFNETCDASAVLNLLGKIPVFSAALKNAADVVRKGRNAWGHCNFTDWNEINLKTRFEDMKQLVKEMDFSPADERNVLADLKDWEDKGVILCMSATIDPELVKVVQERVSKLSVDVEMMSFETQKEFNNLKMELKNTQLCLNECVKRIVKIELDQEILQQQQSSTAVKVDQLTTNQEVLHQEQSSTAVKVDQLTTIQEVLHQEQTSTAVKVEQLTVDQEILRQGHSSTVVKVDQLETSQTAVEQRVADLEGQQNYSNSQTISCDLRLLLASWSLDSTLWQT